MLHTRAILVTALFGLIAAAPGCGPQAARVVEVDPEADRILKQMSDTLTGAKAFSFHADGYMDEYLATGQLVQFYRGSDVVAVRPNRLHVVTDGDDVKRTAWYDGKTLTVLDRAAKAYASVDVPGTTQDMLDHVMAEYGLTIPLADVLFPNLYEALMANVRSGVYLGVHSVDGHGCHHLAFRQERIDWQVWVDAGAQPVPRKLIITYKQEPGQPHYSATMGNWNLSAKPAADQFTSRPPAGTKRVKMAELLGIAEGGE